MPDNSANNKRIVKNTMYLYIKTGLTAVIILYTTRIILRSLGETDFGIFNIVGGVISMLSFLNTAMAVTIQRFLNFEQGQGNFEKQKVIFNVGVVFHICIALIVAFALLILGLFLFDGILNIPESRIPAAKVIYGCLIFSTFITILTVPYDACLNAHENMLYFSIVGIIEALLKLGVALWVVRFAGDKLILYGILMAIVPVLSMMLMRIYCYKKYDECHFAPLKYFEKQTAKEMSSFVGWNLLGTTSNYVGNYGNMIVMNHYFGAVLNTVMGIANQIQGQLMVFSTGMLKALNPIIAKEAGAGNTDAMISYSMKGCKFSYLLLSIFALPMLVETKIVLDLWLGEYPNWTILFVRLQLIRALFEQMTVSMSKALEAEGKIKEFNIVSFIVNILPIPILCIVYTTGGQPYWHYVVAISLMVFVPSIVKLMLCHKYCGMNMLQYVKFVFSPITIVTIITLICGFAITLIMSESIIRLGVNTLLIIFTMTIVTYFILLKSEQVRIKKFILQTVSKLFHCYTI